MIGFAVGMLFVGVVMFFWISFLTRDERMSIEVIPGWELVRIGQCNPGETKLSKAGEPLTLSYGSDDLNCIIIRKIEKPKQFRPFANGAEAYCLWNAVLKLANPARGFEDSRYRISSITRDGTTIGLDFYDYRKAFEMFVCDDGTPFGVEVTE